MLSVFSTATRSRVSISGDEDDHEIPQLPKQQRAQSAQPEPAPLPTRPSTAEPPVVTEIVDNTDELMEGNRNFIAFHERAMAENQLLKTPLHPDELIPAYVKMRRSAKLVRFKEENPDDLVAVDNYIALPKPGPHPWIEGQPIGDYADIVHGDGQLGRVGTGEVGFDNERREYPKEWKGLQPRFLTGLKIPERNGAVSQDMVVKHAFERTGRGLFATADIKKGDTIMAVRSSSVSLGYLPQTERLLDMMKELLEKYHAQCATSPDELEYLHTWIMQGQQSSLVENWKYEHTERLLGRLRQGRKTLDDLQLHPHHIARLAAIVDMNSFVVEGYYNEDRGKGYFPEAGYFNHSCCPNADYDILDEESFKISDFNDEFLAAREKWNQKQAQQNQEGDAANVRKLQDSSDTTRNTRGSSRSENLRNTVGASMLLQEQQQQQQVDPSPSPLSSSSPGRGRTPTKTSLAYYEEELDAQEDAAREPVSSSYLFCCKASRDIAAGEEILIAYVPPEWRHDNRQFVLHERYKFWCRCEACAPTIETMSKSFPRTMLGICVVFFLLNSWVYLLRDDATRSHENAEAGMLFPNIHWGGGVPEGHADPNKTLDQNTFAMAPEPKDKKKFGFWPLTAPAEGRDIRN